MDSKKAFLGMAVLAGALALGAAEEAAKPLIRRDLLVFGSGEAPPPVRNIFRPKLAAPAAAFRPAAAPAPPAAAPRPAPAATFTLSLSYIGSIKSGGRMIALVLVSGKTLSVGEGDEIVPGYRVVQLTADEVVVEGPNAERKTFPRQGDRP